METQLMLDCEAELNGRQRGHIDRVKRLKSAGVPIDRDGMKEWLETTRDRRLEDAGGVYHACTARISNGVDSDLPTKGGCGCRVTRVPIEARHDYDEETGEPLQGHWIVQWGIAGTGYMAPSHEYADTAETACEQARERLLKSYDCFATRKEAESAAVKMLHDRVDADEQKRESVVSRMKRGRRQWRLLADGTVERTSFHGGYRRMPIGETPPNEIIEAAKQAGIEIK